MISYWEQHSFLRYDHIIIGAGIVGLSVAIELRNRYPNDRIMILERGILPTGASSRNAGFACMGSASEILADLATTNEDEVLSLFESRQKGLALLRNRIGDRNLGYEKNGSFELLNKERLATLDKIDYLNKLLKPITKTDAFKVATEKLDAFAFSKNYVKALIENCGEAEIDSGKMLRALCDLAIEHKIEIKTGADVSHFEEHQLGVDVWVSDTYRQCAIPFSCRKVFICTNAFTKKLIPSAALSPGRGQIIVTKPIKNLPFKGIFHFDEGYYYFRAIDDRILLGGGRNIDFEHEETTEFGFNEKIIDKLQDLLQSIIIPNTPFEIEQRWAGIMAFGDTKSPIVQAFSHNVFGAFRMGGMGVALGSLAAQKLVALIQE